MLRDRPELLIALLVGINALSLLDWTLTSRALAQGATEVNFVLAGFMAQSWTAAFAFKIGATVLTTLVLWASRRFRLVLGVAAMTFAVYALVTVYQAGGILLTRA